MLQSSCVGDDIVFKWQTKPVSNVAWENYESNWISKNQTIISSSLKAWWCYILNWILFVIVKLRLIANFTFNVQDTAECNIFMEKKYNHVPKNHLSHQHPTSLFQCALKVSKLMFWTVWVHQVMWIDTEIEWEAGHDFLICFKDFILMLMMHFVFGKCFYFQVSLLFF